jgi:hypothetical protein
VSHLAAEPALSLESDQATSTAGYYQLSWELKDASPDTIYIVTESSKNGASSETIYQGADTATVLSGKQDGSYTYVVKTKDGKQVSNQLSVTVSHHSLVSAFIFFCLGAIVFLSIMIAILKGNADQKTNAN